MHKLKTALQNKAWILDSQQTYTSAMMQELAVAIQAAWTSTSQSDQGIRAPLLDYVLVNKEVLVQVEEFQLVVQHTPLFACDLFTQNLDRGSSKLLSVIRRNGSRG